MAVLTSELSSGQGIPSTSTASLPAFSTVAAGAVLDSLLVSYGLISASAGAPLQSSLNASALAFTNQGNYQTYQSSFVRFFGEGFRQDSSKIYIQKSSLPLLTAKIENTAESLLVALLLQIKQNESNNLISRVVIELFKQEIVEQKINTIFLIKLYNLTAFLYTRNPNTSNQIINSQTAITPNNINS